MQKVQMVSAVQFIPVPCFASKSNASGNVQIISVSSYVLPLLDFLMLVWE